MVQIKWQKPCSTMSYDNAIKFTPYGIGPSITMNSSMLVTIKGQLLLLLALFLASPVIAEEVPASSTQGKHINVTLELHGLDESARILKKASLDLANKISQIDPHPEKMTPEQLQALSAVIKEANRLIQSFDTSVDQAGQRIESLASDVLLAAQQSTIEPTIQSIDDSVSRWLIIIFSGIFLLLVVAGYFIYLTSSQIRLMARTLKSITEDYEIVPKRLAQEKIE
jgi:hypothetical protein